MALTLGKSYLNPKNLLAFALSLTTKGTFNASASPTQVSLSKYRQNSTPAAVSKSEANATNPYAVQVIRAFTDPLAAEAAYSGTINLAIAVSESNVAADFFWYLHVWVTQGESDSVRATLLANYGESSSNEWPTTAAGLALQSAQAISGTWSLGDRICVELGFVARNSVTTSYTGSIYRNSKFTLSDIAAGDTGVTTKNGFIEFSPALTLAAPDNSIVDGAVVVSAFPYAGTFNQQYSFLSSGTPGDMYVPYVDGSSPEISSPIWLKYVATFTGNLYGSVAGSGGDDIVVAAWEDYTAAQLKTTAADFNTIVEALNPDNVSNIVIPVVNGKTYYIVAGYDVAGGSFPSFGPLTITLDTSPVTGTPTPPANGTCATATSVSSFPFNDLDVDTRGADDAEAPSNSLGTIHAPTFYTFTLGADDVIVVHTGGTETSDSNGDGGAAIVGVYTGSCGALSEVRSGIGGLAVSLTAGSYTVVVGSQDAGGFKHQSVQMRSGTAVVSDDFESYTDYGYYTVGGFSHDEHNTQLWGHVDADCGIDGGQAICGTQLFPPNCSQTDFSKSLLPMVGSAGVVEHDVFLGPSNESTALAVRSDAFAFAFGINGSWDTTNRGYSSQPPGTLPNLPAYHSLLNVHYNWRVSTPGDFSTDELHLYMTHTVGTWPSTSSTYLINLPLGVLASDYPGWHHWKIAFRNSREGFGGLMIWVDDVLVCHRCGLAIYTDLANGEWNSVSFNHHGAVDNLVISSADDIVECPLTATTPTDPSELCCATEAGGCCAESPNPLTGSTTTKPIATATGPILPPMTPAWSAACAGGGAVPTAADVTDSENWVS